MFVSSPSFDTVLDTALVLAAGVAVIASVGYLAAQRFGPPTGQRAVWQIVLLAMAGLTVAELAGLSSCVSHLVAGRSRHATPAVAAFQSAGSEGGANWQREIAAPQEADGTRSVPPIIAHVDASFRDSQWRLEETQPGDSGDAVQRTGVDHQIQAIFLSPSPAAGATASGQGESPVTDSAPTDSAVQPSPAGDVGGTASWRGALGFWLVIAWAGGVVLLAGLRALGSLLLWRFCRRLRPLSDDALSWSVYVVSRRLGLRRAVRLREAAGLAAPMAWGLWRPTIALPPGFADDYGPAEQQAMLAHELAHLRGADPLWQRLADWLTVILWWHPLAWWTRRQWQAASERAADEASLVVDGGPELLAECLVQLGGRVSGARPLGWVGMRGGFRSHLGRRVERLLNLGQQRWRPPGRLLWAKALVPVAAVAAAILCTSWARSETSYQGEANMKMVQHYWRQSLLGVALVATLSTADPAADAVAADDVAPVAAAQDQDRPPAKEGERRDGDRPKAERRDEDRPRAEGERKDGDRPAPREGERRDGDRPKGERRDGDQPRPAGGERRDADRPKAERREGDRPRPEDGDQDRQLRHLRAAADNLEAAGRREEAQRLRREIAEREGRGGGDRPGADRPGATRRIGPDAQFRGEGPREGRPQGGGGPHELLGVIRQLQEEVAQLRREMAEMRRMIGREGQPDRPGAGRRPEPSDRPGAAPGREAPPKRDLRPDRPEGDRPRDGDAPRKERDRPRGEDDE